MTNQEQLEDRSAYEVVRDMSRRFRSTSLSRVRDLRRRLADVSNLYLTRWVFLRLLAGVYILAFASFRVQMDGLVGPDGILPEGETLARMEVSLAQDDAGGFGKLARFPTLCWFGDGGMAPVVCVLGMAAGLLALVGVMQPLAFGVLWLCYLSLMTIGQEFMSHPGDTLLSEAGLLAVFFAPWQLVPRLSEEPVPSSTVLFLYRWLVFRLILGSGLAKLALTNTGWLPDLEAISVHTYSPSLPGPLSWFIHHLPEGVQRGSSAIMLMVELLAPLLILASRRFRSVAFVLLVGLQVVILATGNFGFTQVLSLVLCILLLDDEALPISWRARFCPESDNRRPIWIQWIQAGGLGVAGGAIVTVSLALFLQQVAGAASWVGEEAGEEFVGPEWLESVVERATPFRSVGVYGVMAPMTPGRPEIVVQGSVDGATWLSYSFKYKPDVLDRRPSQVAPHLPRLDWRMAVAAAGDRRDPPTRSWFPAFLTCLLEGSEPVLALLAANPFPDSPPRYVRAVLYSYRFTSPEEKARTGRWWERKPIRVYCPPVALPAKKEST